MDDCFPEVLDVESQKSRSLSSSVCVCVCVCVLVTSYLVGATS